MNSYRADRGTFLRLFSIFQRTLKNDSVCAMYIFSEECGSSNFYLCNSVRANSVTILLHVMKPKAKTFDIKSDDEVRQSENLKRSLVLFRSTSSFGSRAITCGETNCGHIGSIVNCHRHCHHLFWKHPPTVWKQRFSKFYGLFFGFYQMLWGRSGDRSIVTLV